MSLRRSWGVFTSLFIVCLFALPPDHACSQQIVADSILPDAPVPQSSGSAPTPQSSDSTQAPIFPQKEDTQTKPAAPTSDEVLQKEEKQRAFGVMPMFNVVSRASEIPPLRPGQKFHLMIKSSTDPFIFMLTGIISGIGQARNTNSGVTIVTNPDGTKTKVPWGFGQGAEGYFKRFGAGYADTVDGNFWGNAVLPVLLKEDPRYYRLGTGSFTRRFVYSASTAIWCRRDNGTWGPNYANVAGNFISGGFSNLYYPAQDNGLEKTVIGAFTVTAEGVIGSELIEFLPDIEHHFLKNRHKHMQ